MESLLGQSSLVSTSGIDCRNRLSCICSFAGSGSIHARSKKQLERHSRKPYFLEKTVAPTQCAVVGIDVDSDGNGYVGKLWSQCSARISRKPLVSHRSILWRKDRVHCDLAIHRTAHFFWDAIKLHPAFVQYRIELDDSKYLFDHRVNHQCLLYPIHLAIDGIIQFMAAFSL